MTPRDLSDIVAIVVHHTAGSLSQTPLEIDAEHRAIGDAMIAYNYVIDDDGNVFLGRPLDVDPAAAFGYNVESVNICLIGDFQEDDANFTGPPSDAAISALTELATQLHRQFPRITRTIGHRDVAELLVYLNRIAPADEGNYSTACPGDQLYEKLPSIKAAIGAALVGSK